MSRPVTAPPARSEAPGAGRHRAVRSPWGRWRHVIVVLTVIGACAFLISLHVRAYTTLSPIDEGVHLDYLYKVMHGRLVHREDVLSQEVMGEGNCRGLDLPGVVLPTCRPAGTYRPEEFPAGGVNYADIHPPTYYGLTAGPAVLLMAAGVDSLVDAGRLVGILWLGAGIDRKSVV